MDVLSGRVLLRPRDGTRTRAFYRDILGLAVAREFGDPADPGTVFHAGGALIEVAGRAGEPDGRGRADTSDSPAHGRPGHGTGLWLQVRDVRAEHDRLRDLGVEITREPRVEPWGLIETWLADPDGTPIVLVEVPPDHPLRRDTRG